MGENKKPELTPTFSQGMKGKVRPVSPEALQEAIQILRQGGVVAFPTETVYGLGADAFNPQAVARIFQVKGRPQFNPLIVHISEKKMVERLWKSLHPDALSLMEAFWPGPLTVILPKKKEVPDIVTAGLPTVAVRLPNHPVAQQLIQEVGPIAAPSANPFGTLSPTQADHVVRTLKQVDLILDGGPCPIGVESTVVALEGDTIKLLRPGAIPLESLEVTLKKKIRVVPSEKPISPGMLPSHYAPRTPLLLWDGKTPLPEGKKGLLTLKPIEKMDAFDRVEVLSPSGDLVKGASRFFSALHRLDEAKLAWIIAIPMPEEGLGLAMMNRLKKAQKKGVQDGER